MASRQSLLRGRLRWAGFFGTLVALVACGPDEVEIPEWHYGEPACMWVIGSRGHFADGSSRVLYDKRSERTGVACLCLSEEEFETQARHAELNDLALETCKQIASQYEFAWDECQMDHDAHRWFTFVFWSAGSYMTPEGDALGCVGE